MCPPGTSNSSYRTNRREFRKRGVSAIFSASARTRPGMSELTDCRESRSGWWRSAGGLHSSSRDLGSRYPQEMVETTLGHPEPSEYAPHAKAYVDLVPGGDPLTVLRNQIDRTLALFEGVDDKRASEWSYEPGKWTLKQVLGHMSDTERILGYRALRIARADQTPLPGFEQDDYVKSAESNARPLSSLLEEFRIVRHSTLSLAEGLPPGAWLRQGEVNDRRLSVRGIFFTAAGHELHHYKLLRERYKLG